MLPGLSKHLISACDVRLELVRADTTKMTMPPYLIVETINVLGQIERSGFPALARASYSCASLPAAVRVLAQAFLQPPDRRGVRAPAPGLGGETRLFNPSRPPPVDDASEDHPKV